MEKVPVYVPNPFTPSSRENHTETDNYYLSSKEYLFESGDHYWIKRYEFKSDFEENLQTSFEIEGESITVRFIDPETKEWVNTSNLANLKNNTLFIDTDKESIVLSVPAVYKNEFTSNTLEIMRELEKGVIIEKTPQGYKITAEFPQKQEHIAEIWALQGKRQLVDFSTMDTFNSLKNQDLALERRWSWDGYYFKIPSNYVPSGENVLYRNPANYTGAAWARQSSYPLTQDMGFVMTEICAKNQNSQGFWATGPKSLWLEADFNIKEGFYDTRFNTDFALSLLNAYKNYNNKEFLTYAINYAEYYCEYAKNNHYEPEGGGWLVEDYAGGDAYNRTHVSLNHQLAEMNFLFEAYNITSEQSYLDVAELMLKGIENTRNKWVLPDNNLAYALYYEGSANVMIDYPYLTYNDLFNTKKILNQYLNKSSDAIAYLMACKKQWMDENNITNYYK